jgi:hypothetical protein
VNAAIKLAGEWPVIALNLRDVFLNSSALGQAGRPSSGPQHPLAAQP